MSSFRETADKAREFHSRYPQQGNNIFRFILEAFCLPLEVFLHGRFGLKYFSLPKAVVGLLFPFVCMLLIDFGVSFQPSIRPWNIGFIRAYPIVHLPKTWGMLGDDFRQTYDTFTDLLTNSGWGESDDFALFALLGYIVTTNLRWLELQWRERTREIVHPLSSGDPYFIWDPLYWICDKLNFQSDMVKQLGEPLLCIFLSQLLNHWLSTFPPEANIRSLKFIAVWLGFGGTLLMLKAALENRTRYLSEYDRRASDLDSLAFEAGDPEVDDRPMSVTVLRRN